MNNMNKHSERGAIMLEVIAVLSLMGLMGAMLFRQIYKRNQELQNIQMASEIRIIKEAFSAYIQANGAEILCPNMTVGVPTECTVASGNLPTAVKEYLPAGFLPQAQGFGGNMLNAMYDLRLLGYLRGPNNVAGQGIRTFVGVVTPKRDALPEGACENDNSAWNTRRAARIAMLIGVDGGIYSPGVTDGGDDDIAGTVGTWHLSTQDIFGNGGADDMYQALRLNNCPRRPPVYIALTELDVYAPEVDLPDQRLNLPENWWLALSGAHVYNDFRVGGKDSADDCYTIQHTGVDAHGNVMSDSPKNIQDCLPAFWVKTQHDGSGDKGDVYVKNDLHVGADPAGALQDGITLSKDGEIVTPKLALTKDGRILSTEKTPSGLSEHGNENYELDLAYTSTMNDIRLASRGGARLSDILPKYILKEQIEIPNPGYNVAVPECPAGYKAALAVIPTRWDIDLNPETELVKEDTSGSGSDQSLGSATFPVTGEIGKDALKGIGVAADTTGGSTTYAIDDHAATTNNAVTGTASLNGLKAKTTMDRNSICVMIDDPTSGSSPVDGATNTWTIPNPRPANPEWAITLGKMTDDSSVPPNRVCSSDSNIHAIVQTYCVFIEDATKTNGVATTGNIPSERLDRFGKDNSGNSLGEYTKAQAACTEAGMLWDNGNHKCGLPAPADATTASTCRLAGGRWDGGTCHAPAGGAGGQGGGEQPAQQPAP